MSKLASETIVDVTKSLVGSIESVGSTHIDEERLKNLKTLGYVIDDLMTEVCKEYAYNKNAYEYSRIESRNKCMQIMKDMYEMLGDYDFVHEGEE